MSGMDDGRAGKVWVTTKTGSMTTDSLGWTAPRAPSCTRSTRASSARSAKKGSLAAANLCDCRRGLRSGPRNPADLTVCQQSVRTEVSCKAVNDGACFPNAGRPPGGPRMRQRLSETLQTLATDALEQRVKPVEALADDAEHVAAAAPAMAIRFHPG